MMVPKLCCLSALLTVLLILAIHWTVYALP